MGSPPFVGVFCACAIFLASCSTVQASRVVPQRGMSCYSSSVNRERPFASEFLFAAVAARDCLFPAERRLCTCSLLRAG